MTDNQKELFESLNQETHKPKKFKNNSSNFLKLIKHNLNEKSDSFFKGKVNVHTRVNIYLDCSMRQLDASHSVKVRAVRLSKRINDQILDRDSTGVK